MKGREKSQSNQRQFSHHASLTMRTLANANVASRCLGEIFFARLTDKFRGFDFQGFCEIFQRI
jgi:hypothetical protein